MCGALRRGPLSAPCAARTGRGAQGPPSGPPDQIRVPGGPAGRRLLRTPASAVNPRGKRGFGGSLRKATKRRESCRRRESSRTLHTTRRIGIGTPVSLAKAVLYPGPAGTLHTRSPIPAGGPPGRPRSSLFERKVRDDFESAVLAGSRSGPERLWRGQAAGHGSRGERPAAEHGKDRVSNPRRRSARRPSSGWQPSRGPPAGTRRGHARSTAASSLTLDLIYI